MSESVARPANLSRLDAEDSGVTADSYRGDPEEIKRFPVLEEPEWVALVQNVLGGDTPIREHCARVLKKLGEKLGLTKLNFQVLRRTMATLAQTKGGIKDVQGILGHSKADTTVNVYMQQIEAGVKQTLDAIYVELTAKPKSAAAS